MFWLHKILMLIFFFLQIILQIQGTADLATLTSKNTADLVIATADALWERDPRPTETMKMPDDPSNEEQIAHSSAPAERVSFLRLVSEYLYISINRID